jgi:hypothetical protein
MRKLAVMVLVFAALAAATALAAQSHPATRRASAGEQVRVDVPTGWHRLHGWLSDVTYPIPRVAVASFPVRLSRHTCECGNPNVRHFPRNGAFLFVWEWSHVTRRQLARNPTRPPAEIPPAGQPQRHECEGPTSNVSFARGGRVFQADLYTGPDASTTTRAELIAVLNSLRVIR